MYHSFLFLEFHPFFHTASSTDSTFTEMRIHFTLFNLAVLMAVFFPTDLNASVISNKRQSAQNNCVHDADHPHCIDQ